MIRVILCSFFIFAAEARTLAGNNCTLSLNYKTGDLKEPQPLILIQNKTSYDFLYPQEKSGRLTLTSSEKFYLSCPGKNNYIQGIPGLRNVSEVEVKCLKDKSFLTDTLKFNFTTVSCKYLPAPTAHRTESTCFENATHIEIGFELKKNFLTTIEVCRDNKTLSTYYTKFTLSKNIGAFHAGYPRPPQWQKGEFFNDYDVDYQYKTKTQLMTVETLIGSKELANEYINNSATKYMAKGHLTAKADFVYGSAQVSTFWYVNAAPQWQTFNAGNWNSLEDNVRRFADRKSLDLVVYTGTHGHMSLLDENNNQVLVYLYASKTKRALPVPRFYWKIIYDPLRMLGTAFVGVNDPYAKEITDDMFICEDVADRINWLTWDPNNIYKGLSYACSISDLREEIPSVPKLKVKGLLY